MNLSIKGVALVLSLSIAGPVAADSERTLAIQYCQSVNNLVGSLADAKKSGASLEMVFDRLEALPGQSGDELRIAKERASRIFVSTKPKSEATRITAECLISQRLVKLP
jgi:hypothetical protein